MENEIIIRAKRGEVRAWEEIVGSYQQRIFNFCYGRCMGYRDSEGIAQDATQITFLRAYKGIKGFKGKSKFSTWLYRIASNVCKDILRDGGDLTITETDMSLPGGGDEGKSVGLDDLFKTGDPSPEQIALKAREKELILECLSKLSEERRDMISLVYYNGLTYREASIVLGCSEGKIKSGLHRAINSLRECLDALLGGRDGM